MNPSTPPPPQPPAAPPQPASAAPAVDAVARMRGQIGRAVIGQRDVIDQVLAALLAGGHVLLEGVPGLGKTMLVRALSQAVDLSFSRIQF
ncbi:MAG: MoxR family ATPase, partial [Acidobacteriota bacterium]